MIDAKLATWRKRSRAVGGRPSTRSRYASEWRRAVGANRKKYNAIKKRMNRPTGRPTRNETNVISRSSVRLPRSGLLAHSERVTRGPLGRSAGLVAIVRPCHLEPGDERAGGHRAASTADRKAYGAVRQSLVLECQCVARANGLQKLRGGDRPARL